MELLKKIWKDSVGSQVIVIIMTPYIIALLTAIKGFFNDSGYWADLKGILCYKVGLPVWCLPIIIGATVFITLKCVQWRKRRDIDNSVIRHQGPYITFQDQPQDQCYCANCWNLHREKVQLPHYYDDTFECAKCKSKGAYDVEKKSPSYSPIYKSSMFN